MAPARPCPPRRRHRPRTRSWERGPASARDRTRAPWERAPWERAPWCRTPWCRTGPAPPTAAGRRPRAGEEFSLLALPSRGPQREEQRDTGIDRHEVLDSALAGTQRLIDV